MTAYCIFVIIIPYTYITPAIKSDAGYSHIGSLFYLFK